tara:strand:- start:4360 stop:4515 length:156 start_codon:yes stop_codon:yes gene_type:complete
MMMPSITLASLLGLIMNSPAQMFGFFSTPIYQRKDFLKSSVLMFYHSFVAK